MKRLVACSLGLLLQAQAQTGLPSEAAQVLSPEQASAALKRIDGQRADLHKTWLEDQQACRRGFWVTDCLKEAQTRHRQALALLKRQQVQIEQAQSEQRSRAALDRVQDKVQTQSQRATSAVEAPSAESPETKAQEREAQARERALRQQQRIEAAELRQRQREREAGARQRPAQAGAAP